jgi:hypothetical protein
MADPRNPYVWVQYVCLRQAPLLYPKTDLNRVGFDAACQDDGQNLVGN